MERELLKKAKWIAYPQKSEADSKVCPLFRREFDVNKSVEKVILVCSGLGVYEIFVGGKRVSFLDEFGKEKHLELKPGSTQILDRKLSNTFDITHLINKGRNAIFIIASHSWWADLIADNIGRYPAIILGMRIYYTDGEVEDIVSDEKFEVSKKSPLISASIYDGEFFDATRMNLLLNEPFNQEHFEKVFISSQYTGEISSIKGAEVVEREDLVRKPVKIYSYSGVKGETHDRFGVIDGVKEYIGFPLTLKKGRTLVVDFGQNASGREYLELSSKKGVTVTVKHAEMLNDSEGIKERGNDGAEGSLYLANLRTAKATTQYRIGGEEREKYTPLYTYYGFRYIAITATDDVTFYDIKGEVLTSVTHDSGFITTGNELVNKLVENARWGMYSNYLSVPTDCPQRDERYGWSADTQIFSASANYLSTSSYAFLRKWMVDMKDASDPNGAFPAIAPRARFGNTTGDLGWADAGIIVPYNVWKSSGELTIVKENYSAMKKYMDLFLKRRKNLGPLPRYGDWLSFEDNSDYLQEYLGVCFYALDALLMEEMAREMGIDEDEKLYRAVYESQKKYFIDKFVCEDGSLALSSQTALLYALKLNLLPNEKSVERVKAQLLENFDRNGNKLQTGFLGTAILLPTLSQFGLNEMAYSLLLNEEKPSWLFSVKQGATTIWERWNSYSIKDGFGEVGMNSFNHYAYGCVVEWLFAYCAGIRPKNAGYEDFILAPIFDKRLGFVKAEYNSNNGKIKSEWEFIGDKVKYYCAIPKGTTATFINPKTKKEIKLTSGERYFEI